MFVVDLCPALAARANAIGPHIYLFIGSDLHVCALTFIDVTGRFDARIACSSYVGSVITQRRSHLHGVLRLVIVVFACYSESFSSGSC